MAAQRLKDMETHRDTCAAAEYTTAVELESQAFRELQAHGPGTEERARAWRAWSEAIVRTNRAWRRMNGPHASRGGQPIQRHADA
jgi:hypothetical protein